MGDWYYISQHSKYVIHSMIDSNQIVPLCLFSLPIPLDLQAENIHVGMLWLYNINE